MNKVWLEYFAVYLGSTVKFIAGPIAGKAASLTIPETAIFTALGSMTSISAIILLGHWIKQKLVNRQKDRGTHKTFSRLTRLTVKIYQRFRMPGIAFLTPLILSPVGGALAAVSFGVKKGVAILHMSWATLMWAFFFSWATQTIWDDIEYLIKTYFP